MIKMQELIDNAYSVYLFKVDKVNEWQRYAMSRLGGRNLTKEEFVGLIKNSHDFAKELDVTNLKNKLK